MTDAPNRLTIRRPDDWHVHLRDGAVLEGVAKHTAHQFARAIVMPNLSPPVTTVAAAAAYRDRIIAAAGPGFTPLMTAYLTDTIDPEEIARGFAEGVFTAAKLYPAHATTGSAHGVTDVANIRPVLERMEAIGMPLLIHGEVTDSHVDIFDREAVFIERTLSGTLSSTESSGQFDFGGADEAATERSCAEEALFTAVLAPVVLASTVLVSTLPSALRRTRPKRERKPSKLDPASRIFPSGWITTARAASS